MYHTTTLKNLMMTELPPLTFQRKISYVTNIREVKALYRLINATIFNDKLSMPKIYVKPRMRDMWGQCYGADTLYNKGKSRCVIMLSERWYCKQWLIMALAHEMVHQWQWDIYSKKRMRQGLEPLMSHGPSFHQWKDKLKKHGIPLKECSDHNKWFQTQHLFKC
jgi:hypothetical protein